MNLPQQRICTPEIDFIDKALVISLPPGDEVVIKWAFTRTIRQNLLALSIDDDSGRPINYLLARWDDGRVDYHLQNPSSRKQFWSLTGWEVPDEHFGGGSMECPKCQDGMKSRTTVRPTVDFVTRTPYYDGAGVRPGDTLVTVEVFT
jgi:hypothetical protein